MNKLILAAFLTLTTTSAFAKEITKFTCGSDGYGIAFSVQFGGPRYADRIHVGYLGEDLKQFLMPNEQSEKTTTESLNMSVSVGECQKVDKDNLLVSCQLHPKAWAISDINFMTFQQLSKDFHQSNLISRNINVKKLDLKVVKGSDNHARLSLNITADIPSQNDAQLKIEKDLGNLEHDWYMCKFE